MMKRFCPRCEDYCDCHVIGRSELYRIDDTVVTISITGPVCYDCGEELGSDASDQAIMDAIRAACKSVKVRTNGQPSCVGVI